MSDDRDYTLKSAAWDGAQASYKKGLAAGRLAGLREAAELVRGHEEVVNLKTAVRSLEKRSDGNLVALAYVAAILALAEGKEG